MLRIKSMARLYAWDQMKSVSIASMMAYESCIVVALRRRNGIPTSSIILGNIMVIIEKYRLLLLNIESVPCMFSMARSKPHSVRKRMLSNIYSKSYLQSSSTFQKLSQSLVYNKLLPLIDSFAVKNDAIDILELNFSSTMDFVSAFIFGLGNGSDFLSAPQARQRWLETYQSRRPFRFWDSELPYVKTLTKNLGYPVVPPWVAEATATIENWVMERCQASKTWTGLISQRSDTTETTPAIVFDQLTKSVAAKTADDPALGSPELQVASELQDHLAAGHETSGITLTYLYWELSRNPALQVSLRNELLKLSPPITPGPSNNQPGQDLPDPRAIDALPLLHAVLMETLRIHAAIPGSQPRVTPYPPISVAGSPPLPSGTRISTQAYSLHRNADVFPDPEVWNPARWLNSSEEKRTEMSKWFWAFGSGGRMCVGRNLAMQGLFKQSVHPKIC